MAELRLSKTPEETLRHAVLKRFKADYDWRSEMIGGTAFERSRKLYESLTSDNTEDASIPRVNLIRRAVEDFLSVALMNVPRAKLKADKNVSGGKTPTWERQLRRKLIEQTELVINAYVESILFENEYPDLVNEAVEHSAIYGVGYLMINTDESVDLRESEELRDLMNKDDELTPEEAARLAILAKRVTVQVINPEQVFWQHHIEGSRRRNMHRVSVIDYASTDSLREAWGDSKYLKHPDLIKPGSFPYYVHESKINESGGASQEDTQCAVLTTWQLEPNQMERVEDDGDGGEIVIRYTDWTMVKTVIAGGQLVDKDEWTSKDGPIRLPIVPFYLREAVKHPYGYSLPLAMEKAEEHYNAIQTIIYKSARKAISSQGVIVSLPSLGDGDLEELEYVLEEGGVARIKGNNTQGPVDVRDMVMPLNYNAAPINPVLLQAMEMQLGQFRMQSQETDEGAMRSARSGVAKRAQMAASDRNKTISITKLNKSVESIYDSTYELIKLWHTSEVGVSVSIPGGGKDYVTLNESYVRRMMVMDDEYVSPENPLGFEYVEFEATLNATNIRMKGEADGRGTLPLDMISRFQILMGLLQAQVIQPETMRELTLDREIMEFDDQVLRTKLEQNPEVQQQMLMFQALANGQQPAQPMGMGGGMGMGMQPAAGNQMQQQFDQDPSSPMATAQNPMAI